MCKIEQEEGLIALALLGADWMLVQRLGKNLRRLGFAARRRRTALESVIGEAAAMPVEVFMQLAKTMEEASQVVNVGIGHGGELPQPGQKCCGFLDAERAVRTKRRQDLERQICFRQRTMMSQVVRGIIRCANDV